VDVTSRSRFSSRNPKLVSISSNGLCRALADGRTEILVAYQGKTERVTVTVTNTSEIHNPSFRQDVLPVLTKSGCNAGNCHGKLAGQNGFKLSLRGYAPEMDYESLTTDLSARRLNFATPVESLLVQKPVGIVPHEGGRRFSE